MIRQRFNVPEVIQSSAMDCGPATLKAMLGGFGIGVNYGRLREACQTSLDGTSIDVLEELLRSFGLAAVQTIVPPEHLFLPEARALPALVVVSVPNMGKHFIIVWRRLGPFVQIMNPANGRRWIHHTDLARILYTHSAQVDTHRWRHWAGSAVFQASLKARLSDIGVTAADASGIVKAALSDVSWRGVARVDASVRMVQALIRSGIVPKRSSAKVLDEILQSTHTSDEASLAVVPLRFWSARPVDAQGAALRISGVVTVQVAAPKTVTPLQIVDPKRPDDRLAPELRTALEQSTEKPERELLRFLRRGGVLQPLALTLGLFGVAIGFIIQSLVFRRAVDLGGSLGLGSQRLLAVVLSTAFLILLMLFEVPVAATALRIGRSLEGRLRIAFMRKLPRISDRYFGSRLSSDMVERTHNIYMLRTLPNIAEGTLRNVILLLLCMGGVIWLAPSTALGVMVLCVSSVLVPALFQPLIAEKDLRARTQVGGLSRFYLDSLQGLLPMRSHAAEANIRRNHEAALTEWVRASLLLLKTVVSMRAVQGLVGYGMSIWILLGYYHRHGEAGSTLLLTYWILALPEFGSQVALSLQQYPTVRNVALRLFEPLGAPEDLLSDGSPAGASSTSPVVDNARREQPVDHARRAGIALVFEHVDVEASGHRILAGVDLSIPAGAHVAIVGPSGAGKSSLVGLLLGWHRSVRGRILIDGHPMEHVDLGELRRAIAWVDPSVQVWNRTLLENLTYGSANEPGPSFSSVVEKAALGSLIDRLPEGLQTSLGEGGGLVSGGEGQRVRLGRALLRNGVRLAILDEPFRGLDRRHRSQLLVSARRHWAAATMLCISHDVAETRGFDLVCVIEQGRVVEYGTPQDLLSRPSRYGQLLQAEADVLAAQWNSATWRRLRLEDGAIAETSPARMGSDSGITKVWTR